MTKGEESESDRRTRWREPSAYWTAVAGGAGQAGKNFAPAAARNTDIILETLTPLMPVTGRALELASGTGQHIVAYGKAFPEIDWYPSDANPQALESVDAWRQETDLSNVHPPMQLDLEEAEWTSQVGGPYDVMLASNLLHISPWEVSLSLFKGAADLLSNTGFLFVYGCFSRNGDPVSQSNKDFDASLKSRDSRWGIKDTNDTAAAAQEVGLIQSQIIEMPANNTVIVLRRR